MGLWENELDLYGTDRIGQTPPKMPPYTDKVSSGALFPLSGMNLSIRNDAAPFLMFLPNFTFGNYKFTRHDDIWGGYIFQLVARAKGFALSYGQPTVFHDTIVIPEEDAAEEEAMIKYEKEFYDMATHAFVHAFGHGIENVTPTDLYDELATLIGSDTNSPFKELAPAFDFAADLFDEHLS